MNTLAKIRSLGFVATLSALPAFADAPTPDVPGDSFVTMSDVLRAEALSGLGDYAKEKHGCATPNVLDTRSRSVKGAVRLGKDGRLLAGTITEHWRVDVCGTTRTFVVVLSPPVEGASGIAITERS